jgi:hypothetical protein
MNYIYFYLYSFFRCAPKNKDASGWAATVLPLLFVVHIESLWFGPEVFLYGHIILPHAKIIIGGICFCLFLWSYWYYEMTGRGEKIIASFSGLKNKRRSAIIGGIIFFEMVLAGMLPAIIAVIQNPTP